MEKKFNSLEEMLVRYEKEPETKYLWNGVKDKSFGLVFGPSKSGKTIFCENLAMQLAAGKKSYFGYELDGTPRKVLFIGLEEFWKNRMERNKKQFLSFSEEDRKTIGSNYLYQSVDFDRMIINKEQWNKLLDLIKSSDTEVVFIDSITRMNPGKLEDSHNAEIIMQRLRNLCYDNGITLFCIHHTPKMQDCPITMDKIKGSAVFAQEADFAIGINCTTKKARYMKNVFFRYAPDDDENVTEFVINESTMLEHVGEPSEYEILNRTDRRRNTSSKEKMASYINSNTSTTYSTDELVGYFESNLDIKERQIKTYLSNLVKEGKVLSPQRGLYTSLDYFKTNS